MMALGETFSPHTHDWSELNSRFNNKQQQLRWLLLHFAAISHDSAPLGIRHFAAHLL